MLPCALTFFQLSCSRTTSFVAFHDQGHYPFPLDSLVLREPFTASGKVLAMKGDVRYLARWAFAAREGGMRVQVFGMEGTFLADMSVREDSAFVLLPQEMEYHRGAADRLPLGALLGLEIAWRQAIGALDVLLWPPRGPEGWIPGTWGGKDGWFHEKTSVFVHLDPERRVPQYIRAGTGRNALVGEVDSFLRLRSYYAPERLSFEWPGHDARMWLEITSRITADVEDHAFSVPCPESVVTYDW